MAQKKAYLDPVYRHIKRDAKKIVVDWFRKNDILVDSRNVHVIWLGLVPTGYRCMVNCTERENYFFEIFHNMLTDETICTCFKRFEYFVMPSHSEAFELSTSHKKPFVY